MCVCVCVHMKARVLEIMCVHVTVGCVVHKYAVVHGGRGNIH